MTSVLLLRTFGSDCQHTETADVRTKHVVQYQTISTHTISTFSTITKSDTIEFQLVSDLIF